jgi:AraC family transcriptional regulator
VDARPIIHAHGQTSAGAIYQIRYDPPGDLDGPALGSLMLSLHIGAAARLACRRNGKHYRGSAVHGDIDIIPPHTPSRWEMLDSNDNSFLLILPSRLLSTAAHAASLDPSHIDFRDRFQIRDAELESLGWAMKREIETGSASGPLYLDGLAIAATSRIISRHSSAALPESTRRPRLEGRRLKRVLTLIEDELSSALTMDRIASVAGFSTSHMAALFREATGIPVHRYVIDRRLERAGALLRDTNLPIAEIAQAVGFAHQSHMDRHMRRRLGASPIAIRRAAR